MSNQKFTAKKKSQKVQAYLYQFCLKKIVFASSFPSSSLSPTKVLGLCVYQFSLSLFLSSDPKNGVFFNAELSAPNEILFNFHIYIYIYIHFPFFIWPFLFFFFSLYVSLSFFFVCFQRQSSYYLFSNNIYIYIYIYIARLFILCRLHTQILSSSYICLYLPLIQLNIYSHAPCSTFSFFNEYLHKLCMACIQPPFIPLFLFPIKTTQYTFSAYLQM